MNFNINFKSFFANVRPYFLNGLKMAGVLNSFAVALQSVNLRFNKLRNDTRFILAFNMQIIYIEKYLNEVYPNPFSFPNNIHILDTSNVIYNYVYNYLEQREIFYFRNFSESAPAKYLKNSPEFISNDFIIMIPTFCQTANDNTGQLFNEFTFRKRVNFYNLGGKKYEIQYF